MAQCRSCGAQLEDAANYCPRCGTAVRMPYQPQPAYAPPPHDRNVVIIVVVVIAVLLLPFVLSGILYLMVTGPGTPAVPTVVISKDSPSADKIVFTIVAVTHEADLNDVWVNMRTRMEEGGMNAGYSLFDGYDTSTIGNDWYWLTYNDKDSDRMLSSGDTVSVTSVLGPLPTSPYTLELRSGYGGLVMGTCTFVTP